MRRLITTSMLAALVILGGRHLSRAQDTDSPPPPVPAPTPLPPGAGDDAPQAPPPAPKATDDDAARSDPEALALLAAAAERQGGEALAATGALRSFRIEFAAIKVWRWTQNEAGTWNSANEVFDSMAIDWMRNPGKDSSLRTFWEINGKKIWRAVHPPRGVFWLSDGKEITILTEGTHDADREEVLLQRRLSETLLDVAVLHKLRNDGSVWTMVDDAAYEGLALHRTPAPGTTGLTFTIWLDTATKDPHHVRVEPVANGAPTMHYELRYQDDLPASIFYVKGADLRFPREVGVLEEYPGIAPHKVMNFFVRNVTFNAVETSAFKPRSTLGH